MRLSLKLPRGELTSVFFLSIFLTRENRGDCSYSRFNQAWLNKNQIKKAKELDFKKGSSNHPHVFSTVLNLKSRRKEFHTLFRENIFKRCYSVAVNGVIIFRLKRAI